MARLQESRFSPLELRAILGLALIFGLRLAGLFLILPVFSLLARDLPGATPFLVGLAISSYGFTQALLQIPFGLLSDLVGRKRVIAAGLLLFATGSVVAALAGSIWGVILGRALQGSGAIAAAVMALLADLTREEHRTRAMATVGATIGLAFALSIVAGPPLGHLLGLRGLFWLIAGLALLALLVLLFVVPTPRQIRHHLDAEPEPGRLLEVLRHRELLRLDFGIFALHLLLTANFVVLPIVLREELAVPVSWHSLLYLAAMGGSLLFMVPLVVLAEKRGLMKPVFLLGVFLIFSSQLGWFFGHGHLWSFCLALFLFFAGFNLLEALLPSLVSKTAPVALKGTAMGIYTSCQFLGAFAGGTLGGYLLGLDLPLVWLAGSGLALLWLLLALTMAPPRRAKTFLLSLEGVAPEELALELRSLKGILEVVVVPEEGAAYLKIDPERFDLERLEQLLEEHSRDGQQGDPSRKPRRRS